MTRWLVILCCILAIMVVEITAAVGRETGLYVLVIGLVIIILNEIRLRRADSV